MKNVLFYALVALVLFSCKTEELADYAIISGKIKNNGFPEITLTSLDNSFETKISLYEDGSFYDTLRIRRSGLFTTNYQRWFYLQNGYELKINYDAENPFETINFSGKGANFNQYLLQKDKVTSRIVGNYQDLMILEKAVYKKKFQEVRDTCIVLLDELDVSEFLKAREKRNINYDYLNALAQYPIFFKADARFEEAEQEIAKLDYLDDVEYNYSHVYKNFLAHRYFENEVSNKMKEENLDATTAFFETMRQVSNEIIRNSILYQEGSRNMTMSAGPKAYFEKFLALSTNKSHQTKITEVYQEYTRTKTGMPSANFIDYENHAGGHTSLTDLRGKYLYIDVWATWCNPCLQQIPALKKLEEKYADKNIEFVSISVDKKHQYEQWKKMVADKNLGGIQLIADNEFESDFIKAYNINYIPRFILLDTEGNILSANAPFPSDDAVHKTLDAVGLE